MYLVADEENSRFSHFKHRYCLSLKDMAWNHTARHINNSDPGHTRLEQQLEKNLKMNLSSLSKSAVEKRKK